MLEWIDPEIQIHSTTHDLGLLRRIQTMEEQMEKMNEKLMAKDEKEHTLAERIYSKDMEIVRLNGVVKSLKIIIALRIFLIMCLWTM